MINAQRPVTQSCDHPIRKFAVWRDSSDGRLAGIYSPVPSELVPGNKATRRPQLRLLSSPNVQAGLASLLVISVQTGTQIQSVEKINKNCNTAELQTNHRPDKMDQKQKRGETESRMHMPSQHDSSVALSVITACEGNGCNTPFTKWRSPRSSSWCG